MHTYFAFKEMCDFCCPSRINITDFLLTFEYLYHKIAMVIIQLPEGVQAFSQLIAVIVSDKKEVSAYDL